MLPGDHASRPAADANPPAFLIMDTESVPDGKLLARVKYPTEAITEEEAVLRAQTEVRDRTANGSDFVPVTFQYPVAVRILRVAQDFTLQAVKCLDAPQFRPRKIVEGFWLGLTSYREKLKDRVKLVTFNGRGFDLPLLEQAAFRYGCRCGRDYYQNSRNRYGGGNIDLMELLSNFGAVRANGGLNLLSKLLGKPGKMDVTGEQVYQMFLQGRLKEINDYCLFDTLDTYFVFLRTRVMMGELSLAEEHTLALRAKQWLEAKVTEQPALQQYLENWGEWNPWP